MARLGTKNRNHNDQPKIVFSLAKCSCSGSIEYIWNVGPSDGMGGCTGTWTTTESCAGSPTCSASPPIGPTCMDSCGPCNAWGACIGGLYEC